MHYSEKVKAVTFSVFIAVALPWVVFCIVQWLMQGLGDSGRQFRGLGLLIWVGGYALSVWVAAHVGYKFGLESITFLAASKLFEVGVLLRYSCLTLVTSVAVVLLPFFLFRLGELRPVIEDITSTDGVVALVVIGLAVPVVEEIVYRGIALSQLEAAFSSQWAIALTTLFWTVVHYDRALFLVLLGVIYAGVTIRTRSLIPAIVGHVALNVTAILVTALRQ